MSKDTSNDDNNDELTLVEEEIKSALREKQRENLEKELDQIKNIKKRKGKTASIFHLKEGVVGQKNLPKNQYQS